MIAVLVPSTSRNRDWKTAEECLFVKVLLPCLASAAKGGGRRGIRVYLGVDNDDVFFQTHSESIKSISNENGVELIFLPADNPRKSPVDVWNRLFKTAFKSPNNEYFLQIGDDIVIHNPPETFSEMVNLMATPDMMVWPIDSNNVTIATQSFVTRNHYETFGFYFPHEIENWCCDNWITEVYVRAGKYAKTAGAVMCNVGGDPRYTVKTDVAHAVLPGLISQGVKLLKFFNQPVLIALIIINNNNTLDGYLECIRNQTYPKKCIHLWINVSDDDIEINKYFNFNEYASVTTTTSQLDDIVEIYDQSIAAAKALNAHYFNVSCNNLITAPHTLEKLVETGLPAVAPYMTVSNSLFSNYHHCIDDNGYFKSCEEYTSIQKVPALHEVAVINNTYLLSNRVLGFATFSDGTHRAEYVSLCDSLRKASIQQYLDTREVYGEIVF